MTFLPVPDLTMIVLGLLEVATGLVRIITLGMVFPSWVPDYIDWMEL
jgi:hypothetical protein